MTVYIQWWDRNDDFTPNYFNEAHHGNIHGANAAECMAQIRNLKYNHDLIKYTAIEIVEIAD